MKRQPIHFVLRMMLAGAFVAALLSSCIHDDHEDCPLTINFDYSHNIKNANAFEMEASKVSVWLFGEDGKFILQHIEEGSHVDNSYRMTLPELQSGEYTLVAWARGNAQTDEYANCDFPQLTPGVSTVADLNPRFKKKAGDVSDTELNPLLVGCHKLIFSNTAPIHCTLSMMKCTNKVRILLMPTGVKGVKVDKYDFLIEDENGWLNHQGDKYQADAINYKPYYTATLTPPGDTRSEGEGAQSIAVASINTSRFFYADKPRLAVVDKESGEEKFELKNLTWYLALLATLEHNDRWGEQEYLDREDYFDIMIYVDVDGDKFMKNKIVIKDWVISIDDDISLGN